MCRGENFIIPFLGNLRNNISSHNLTSRVYGHSFPSTSTLNFLKKCFLHFRREIPIERIVDIRNSMIFFQNYNYSIIFNFVKNVDLLYYVAIASLIENMGIIYLRILTEVPYYRPDRFFIKDFIVHSASYLHSVNVIYKVGLNDHRIMKVFKAFVAKNFKLCAFFTMPGPYPIILSLKE